MGGGGGVIWQKTYLESADSCSCFLNSTGDWFCSQNLSFSPQAWACLLPRSNCSFGNVFIHHASKRTNIQHNAEVCTPPGEFVLILGFQNGGSGCFSLQNHSTPFKRCSFYLLLDQVTLIKAFLECVRMCGISCLSAESSNEVTRGQYFQMLDVQLLWKVNSLYSAVELFTHECFFLKVLADSVCTHWGYCSSFMRSYQIQFEDDF